MKLTMNTRSKRQRGASTAAMLGLDSLFEIPFDTQVEEAMGFCLAYVCIAWVAGNASKNPSAVSIGNIAERVLN